MPTDLLSDRQAGMSSAMAGAGYRFSPWRRGFSGNLGAIYPNPFLDVAQNYMPKSITDLFSQCEYYALSHPLISAVVTKMSAYGITDLVYSTSNQGLKDAYQDLFEKVLRIRQFVVNVLMDYHCYGNAFVSVLFPFRKYLVCKNCGTATPINRSRYRFSSFKFRMRCRECDHHGDAIAKDIYYPSHEEVDLVRWYPKHIKIEQISATGECLYRYQIPKILRNAIRVGKPAVIQKTPQIFIEALQKNRSIVFRQDNMYHLKRSTVSRRESAWGTPMILPVLKDAFYLQILRKGQEAVALDHTVPLRVIFPQQSTQDANPYSSINLVAWQEAIKRELAAWRKDPNYIPIMPLPMGYQSIGGDGRALMLHQEIRVWAEHICAGLGVPVEFVFGGLSYSGSNVSLRMLENTFMGLREDTINLVNWIRDKIMQVIGWPRVNIDFKPFKMADDLQRAAFDFQLVGAKMLSKQTLLENRDHDYMDERRQVSTEVNYEMELNRRQQLYNAETQGRSAVINAQHQSKAMAIQQTAQAEVQAQLQPQVQPGMEGQPQQPGQQAQPQQAQPGAEQQQAAPPAQGQMQAQPGTEPQPGAPPAGPPPAASNLGQMMEGQGRPVTGPGGIVPTLQSPISEERMEQAMVGTDIRLVAARLAQQIQMMTDYDRAAYLNDLEASQPELHWQVMQYLYGQQQQAAMQPLPEQLPPRRGVEKAMI